MARSLLAQNVAAATRATRAVFGTAGDKHGRPLLIWWPRTPQTARRSTATDYHTPPIRAHTGPGRRRVVSMDGGLPVIARQTVSFVAELMDFPNNVPPRENIHFLAGPSVEERRLYCVRGFTEHAGVVEIEATEET